MESDEESSSVTPSTSDIALEQLYSRSYDAYMAKLRPRTTGFRCKPMKNKISHFSRSCNTHCCACFDAFLEYYAEVFRFMKLLHQGKLKKEPTYVADIFNEIIDIACCWLRDCCTFLRLIFKCMVCATGKRGGTKYHCRQFKTKLYNPVSKYSDPNFSDYNTNMIYTSKTQINDLGGVAQSTITQKIETKTVPTERSKSSIVPSKSVKSILSNKSRKSLTIDDRSDRSRCRSRHKHDQHRSHSGRRPLGRTRSAIPYSYSSAPYSYRCNGRSASVYSNLSRNHYANRGFYVLKHDKKVLGLRPMPFRQWGPYRGCVVMRLALHEDSNTA